MTSPETPLHTSFIVKEEVVRQVKKCSEQFVSAFLKKLISADDLLTVSIADGPDYINHVARINEWPDYIRKLFLQCYFIAERSVKSSGNISAYFFACKMLNKESLNLKNIKVKRPDISDSFSSLSSFVDLNIFEFVKSTIEHLGIKGSLSIKKTHSSIPTLELKSCHVFNIGLESMFLKEVIHRDEAKIVLYDGVIESVSQVDRLFNEISEQKISCVLVARSFSNDVLSTINANQARKTLDVIPVQINDCIENVNVLSDIATCLMSNLITAETGLRLSNMSVSDLTTATGVKISHKTFYFDQKEKAKNSINKRIQSIKKKIQLASWDEKMSKEDIELVYGDRLDSLNANSVYLWVKGGDSFVQYLNNVFSFSINYIAAFANSGTVSVNNLSKRHTYILPASIADISNITSEHMCDAIHGSGGCVAIQ